MIITGSRVVFSFVALALVACSSAPPDSPLQGQVDPQTSSKKNKKTTTTGGDDSEGQTTGGTTTTQDPADPAAPANPATPATPIPPAGGGQCAASATFDACFQCCDQAFPGGFDLDSNAFGNCACQSPGVCAQVCATSFCAGGQATIQCEQCLATATQCQQVADTACAANANCTGALNCFDSSGCDAKP